MEKKLDIQQQGKEGLKAFLSFDSMIVPSIIKGIFYLGVGLCLLFGVMLIGSGLTSTFGGGAQVFGGLMVILIGPIIIRIQCELIIILFKIHEELKIANRKPRGFE